LIFIYFFNNILQVSTRFICPFSSVPCDSNQIGKMESADRDMKPNMLLTQSHRASIFIFQHRPDTKNAVIWNRREMPLANFCEFKEPGSSIKPQSDDLHCFVVLVWERDYQRMDGLLS